MTRLTALAVAALTLCAWPDRTAADPPVGRFPPESVYDTAVGPDEALVNVHVRNSRWPDCTSLETAVADIFRLEGVNDTPDASEAKAMALWTWSNTLFSNRGSRVFEGVPTAGPWVRCEGDKDTQRIEIRRGDKLLMVYGAHECGGTSRVMADLWRSAGFLGYQEPSTGHSTAVLRYPDADGVWRMHTFNPQGRNYYWNPRDNRVGTRTLPVMSGVVYNALLPPLRHSLRTSLRPGETVTRRWENDGYIQITDNMEWLKARQEAGQDPLLPGVAGQEDQELLADTDPASFRGQLYAGSTNVACSPGAPALEEPASSGPQDHPGAQAATKRGPPGGGAALHPARAGQTAEFIYRLASPFVAIETEIEATLLKTADSDLCRLSFSNNMGQTWHVFHDKQTVGREQVRLSVGRELYFKPAPSITSHYVFLIKAQFRTAGRSEQVGADALKITVRRQLNMRALPSLMPGENVLAVTGESIRPGLALRLDVEYEVNGQPKSVSRTVARFPHYFRIDVTDLPADRLKTPEYLDKWGGGAEFNLPTHPLRMRAIRMRLVPADSARADDSLPAEQAEAAFSKAHPNPHRPDRRMISDARIPQHEGQVSGFFPQLPDGLEHPADPREWYNWLIERVAFGSGSRPPACPEGTDPVQMMIERLPRAHGVHTLAICAVLAQMRDKRAMPALLAKWEQAPRSGPGDRYIPDVLAAMGDRSVVPALVKPLHELRMDYRVHIARALGILGGEQAVRTLEYLARADPNISVRGEARRALDAMASDKAANP